MREKKQTNKEWVYVKQKKNPTYIDWENKDHLYDIYM